MKKLKIISLLYILSISLIVMFIYSCKQQEVEALPAHADFTLDPSMPHVGEPFTITLTEANENTVVYFGDTLGGTSRVYEDYPNAKGFVITGSSAVINSDTSMYSKPGTYKITVVARNYGKWSTQLEEDVISQTVTVTDQETAFTSFGFQLTDAFYAVGSFKDDSIIVRVPFQRSLDSVIASFVTASSSAKVYVGSVLQTSGVTKNNFTSSVKYKVEADDGTTQEYIVAAKTYKTADTLTNLLSFKLTVAPSAVITIATDTVTINLPWGYKPSSSEVVEWSIPDYAVGMYVDGVYQLTASGVANLASGCELKIEAQSGAVATYYTKLTYRNAVLSFGFTDLVPSVVGVITDTVITCDVYLPPLDTTVLTAIIPSFSETNGKSSVIIEEPYYPIGDTVALINNIDITNGNKAVNFNSAADSFMVMDIKGNDGITVQYRIEVKRH